MRKSVQKETILKIIDESTSHLTSKGVYEIVKKTIPHISLGTVYRNLEKLTMENKIKPDALLGYNPTKITVAEAKKKGYIIPDGYKEQYVPEINYAKIDKVLQIAKDNNLSVRFHTLVWHSQTPDWFFKNN